MSRSETYDPVRFAVTEQKLRSHNTSLLLSENQGQCFVKYIFCCVVFFVCLFLEGRTITLVLWFILHCYLFSPKNTIQILKRAKNKKYYPFTDFGPTLPRPCLPRPCPNLAFCPDLAPTLPGPCPRPCPNLASTLRRRSIKLPKLHYYSADEIIQSLPRSLCQIRQPS